MAEVREVLREVGDQLGTGPTTLELVRSRRDRRRRNRRLGSAVLALVVAVAGLGGVVSIFRSSGTRAPATPSITTRNVRDLSLRWTADLGSPVVGLGGPGNPSAIPFAPTAADGSVFVSTTGVDVFSFPATCAPGVCAPTWRGQTLVSDIGHQIVTTPTVADGEVLVGTLPGGVFAFPEACQASCRYDWVGEAGTRILSAPVVSNGFTYVVTAAGRLTAFPLHCGTDEATCHAAWSMPLGPGRPIPFEHAGAATYSPVAADGVVYALGFNRRLYAFDAHDGRLLWFGGYGRVCCGTRAYAPLVAGDHDFAAIGNTLFAFPVGCGSTGAECAPAWTYGFGRLGLEGVPISTAGLVVVGAAASGVPGVIDAFDVSCSKGCRPVWTASPWPPVGESLFNGLVDDQGSVYNASYLTNAVAAIGTSCGRDGALCQPSWTWSLPEARGPSVERLSVGDGLVFVSTADGRLFALPSQSAASCRPVWSSTEAHGILAPPQVEAGTLIAASAGGRLYAFAPRAPEARATPQARRTAAFVYGALALIAGAAILLRALRRRRT